MHLLLIEDDAALSQGIKTDLEQAGFVVDAVDNGIDGEFLGNEDVYDLVILDLGLPGRSGLEVLTRWRAAANKIPVLILTARDAWHERVDGFKAGADDYLGKPFHTEELLARVQALLRRSNGYSNGPLQVQGLTLDEDTQSVSCGNGQSWQLTRAEFRLLRYFMMNPGKIVSKSRLLDHLYELEAERTSNVLEAYITRLRRKLGREVITTRRGQGYVFGAQC